MNVAADTDPLPFQPDTPFPPLLRAVKGYSIVRMTLSVSAQSFFRRCGSMLPLAWTGLNRTAIHRLKMPVPIDLPAPPSYKNQDDYCIVSPTKKMHGQTFRALKTALASSTPS